MRILLLGGNGQLGGELHRCLMGLGDVIALDQPEVDFCQPQSLRQAVVALHPDWIVNAAAYTNVDRAESEPQIAHLVNAESVGVLAEAALHQGAFFVHYSTDYVFDGKKGQAYIEADETRPLNVYGESKLAGEKAVQAVGGKFLILRTSWVYSLRQGGFVPKVLEWAHSKKELRIVSDQVGSPTWAYSLAVLTTLILSRAIQDETGKDWLVERKGIYHAGGNGVASRYEWAQAILAADPMCATATVERLLAARTEDFPTPARRPLFTALNCDRLEKVFGLRLPDWKMALALCLKDQLSIVRGG